MGKYIKLASVAASALAASFLALPAFAQATIDQSIIEGIDSAITERGTIRMGSQQTFPPMEYREAGADRPIGATVDLIEEAAGRLNLKVEWVTADFATLIAGLQANRFDITSGGMADLEEREEAIDFVNFFASGLSFLVRKEDDGKYNTMTDFCGHTVSLTQGSTGVIRQLEAGGAKCKEEGKETIEMITLPASADARAQVDLKRADAFMSELPQLSFIVSQFPDRYTIAGNGYISNVAIMSWGLNKKSTGLRDAVAASLQSMVEDGTYKKTLEKWGVQAGALDKITINLPASKRPELNQ